MRLTTPGQDLIDHRPVLVLVNQAGAAVFKLDFRLHGAQTQADVGGVRRPGSEAKGEPVPGQQLQLHNIAADAALRSHCGNGVQRRPVPGNLLPETQRAHVVPGHGDHQGTGVELEGGLARRQPRGRLVEQREVGGQAAEPALPPGMPALLFGKQRLGVDRRIGRRDPRRPGRAAAGTSQRSGARLARIAQTRVDLISRFPVSGAVDAVDSVHRAGGRRRLPRRSCCRGAAFQLIFRQGR